VPGCKISVGVSWLWLLLTIAGRRASGATAVATAGLLRRVCLNPWLGGLGRSGDRHVPGSAISPQFIWFLPQLHATGTAWLRAAVTCRHASVQATCGAWPGARRAVLPVGRLWCSVLVQGKFYGSAAPEPMAGDGPAFSCCGHTLVTRTGCPSRMAMAFPGWFLSVSAIWSVTPPCCNGTAGLATSSAWVACCSLLALVVVLAPGRRPGSAYCRLGLWASSPEFPVWPVPAGPGSGGVVVLLRRPPLNGWLHPARWWPCKRRC